MQRSLHAVLVSAVALMALHVSPAPAGGKSAKLFPGRVERGKYLANFAGCTDCHSPKVFTPTSMEPDTTRLLSGHPAGEELPEVPVEHLGPGKWGAITNAHLTAWAGPWGISFARNLTPDVATGLGSWTPEMFVKTIRTGRHMGEGRPLLPPMPWQQVATLTDDDLKAVFAYLQSLRPIENAVPDPIPPAAAK